MQYLDKFLMTIIAVIAAGLGGLILVSVKWLFNINKNVNGMVKNGKNRAVENQVQFQVLRAHSKAMKAILEVVSQTQNNGNVTKAFSILDEAEKVYECYSDGLVTFEDLQRRANV